MITKTRPQTKDQRPKANKLICHLSFAICHLPARYDIGKVLYLVFLALGILASGCASVSQHKTVPGIVTKEYIKVQDFCNKHGFQYNYDTLDDTVRIFSSDKEIRIILDSPFVYFNGNIFCLKDSPEYRKGVIVIPNEVEKIISAPQEMIVKPSLAVKKIVIDPGHGGKDPGAISRSGIYEKTINLFVSKYLEKELGKRGFTVILTRKTDIFLSLQERVDIAKKYNADLFLSVHANSNRSHEINGIEVYYLNPSGHESKKLSKANPGSKTNWAEILSEGTKSIFKDMCLTKNQTLSVELAHQIYYTFKDLGFKIKPPKKAKYYVLKNAVVPSILLEIGYLSNKYEEKILRKSHYQKQIAEAVAMGVTSLYNRYTAIGEKAAGSGKSR
ncbi:MAG: N-acetylmuramoyl-L-alanine amidase [Candidatus Omnitrophota bacterium]